MISEARKQEIAERMKLAVRELREKQQPKNSPTDSNTKTPTNQLETKKTKFSVSPKTVTTNTGIDPKKFQAALTIGVYHLEDLMREAGGKVVNFAEWSKRTIADTGEVIRPYLEKVWKEITAKPIDEVWADIKKLKEQKEEQPFDCGLDTEIYDDGLIKALNKIGADFTARIEKLEKAAFQSQSNSRSKKISINCPKCGRSLKGATQEMIGDTGICPECKAEFTIEQKQ